MTAWHRGRMLAFDTETTGPDPDWARIVTATVVEIGSGGITATHQWLLNPGVQIPQGAIDVHGVTNERARAEGMDPAVAVFEIAGLLALNLHRGVPVVAYNGSYDLTVLDRECRRHGIDTLNDRLDHVGPIVDPFVIDKAVGPRQARFRKGKRTLTASCEHYGVRLDGAHDATADALAAARVAYRQAEMYPDEVQLDLPRLHSLQVTWRREQCASLAAYFAKQGKPQDVNGDWPVQTLPDGWAPGYHPAPERAAAVS